MTTEGVFHSEVQYLLRSLCPPLACLSAEQLSYLILYLGVWGKGRYLDMSIGRVCMCVR